MSQVAITAAATRIGWDFKLREDSRPRDIFGMKRGIYRDGQKVTDAFIVTKKAENGEQTKTMTMIRDLVGSGRFGAEGLVGHEELQRTFEMRVYFDEVKHGVPYEEYGFKANKAKPYSFVAQIQPQLSDWVQKLEGRRIREALCQGVDSVIVAGAQSDGKNLAYPHSNIFVAQTGNVVSKVTYHQTITNYATNLATALGSVAHVTDLGFLDELAEKMVEAEIEGINADGDAMYFLTVPPKTYTKMYGLLREYYKYTNNEEGLKGKGGRIYRNFIIVEDVFAPRVAVISATSVAFSFRGITEGRATAANLTPDVGFILGAQAIVEYIAEDLHFETETQEYKQKKGMGIFANKGYNRVDWEGDVITTPRSAFRRNISSALILFKSN